MLPRRGWHKLLHAQLWHVIFFLLVESQMRTFFLQSINQVPFCSLVPILLKCVSPWTDNWQIPVPFLPVSSAVFDTVSHTLLLPCCTNLASVGRSMQVTDIFCQINRRSPHFYIQNLSLKNLVRFNSFLFLIQCLYLRKLWLQRFGKRPTRRTYNPLIEWDKKKIIYEQMHPKTVYVEVPQVMWFLKEIYSEDFLIACSCSLIPVICSTQLCWYRLLLKSWSWKNKTLFFFFHCLIQSESSSNAFYYVASHTWCHPSWQEMVSSSTGVGRRRGMFQLSLLSVSPKHTIPHFT